MRSFEMDTSTCSLNNQTASKSVAQRKFYQWVLKWINGRHVHTESNIEESRDVRNSPKPDVPILASFLQTIGFKLVSFEKHNDGHIQRKDENCTSMPKPGILKIAIECGSSNMKAILELGDITCRCPNPDHVKDASFWSISGTEPTGSTDNIVQKIEETGSNLLPRLSKDVSKVLHDVANRLFEIIIYEPDVNRNTNINLNASSSNSMSYEPKFKEETLKKEIGVVRSYTQPEMHFRKNSSNSKNLFEAQGRNESGSQTSGSRNVSPIYPNKSALQRQKTWDMDIETGSLDGEPRPSPPKITSSPSMIAELSKSLGQISLQGEIEIPQNVAEYIIGAQQNLEKALKILSFKKTINDLSPNQDHDGASVKSAPAHISPAIVSPYKPNRSTAIGNVKLLPILNHTTPEQQPVKLNTGNAGLTPKARRSITSTLYKSTLPKSIQSEQEISKLRRRSFYLPSSTNSNHSLLSKPSDAGQKLLGNEKIMRTNITIESDLPNRGCTPIRKISPEQRINISQNLDTFNISAARAPSMIKPPTKIMKSIPIKIKPVQPSKISTGVTKKSRMSLSKE